MKASIIPALMLHKPHSALLYVTMLSLKQRKIAPENHHYTVKRRTARYQPMICTYSTFIVN
jgi:hypothetical protein